MDKNIQKAKKIIHQIFYITIATASPEGEPWNSPVYSAYDEQYNFYWASWKENVHSQNIRPNDRVFLVIYDSTVPAGTGEGVYVQARAYELSDRIEIAHALQQLYSRANRKPRQVDEFLGEYPRRVYKAVPEKMWVNGDGDVKGNYVDVRFVLDIDELRKKKLRNLEG